MELDNQTIASKLLKLEKTVERLAIIINNQDKKIRTLKNDNFALKIRVDSVSNTLSSITRH
jgi:hypothetical protein